MKILFKSTIANENPAKFVYDVFMGMDKEAGYNYTVKDVAENLKNTIQTNAIDDPEQFLEDVSAKVRQMISQENKEKETEEYERKIKEELVPAIDNFFAGFSNKSDSKNCEELKKKLKIYLGIDDNRYYTPTEVTSLLSEIISQEQEYDKYDDIYDRITEEFNEYYGIKEEYIEILSELGIASSMELFRYHLRNDVYMIKNGFRDITMFNLDILKKVLESKKARFKTLEIIEREVGDIEL